jgi:hypothetical protein
MEIHIEGIGFDVELLPERLLLDEKFVVRAPAAAADLQPISILARPAQKLPQFVGKARVLDTTRTRVHPFQKIDGNVSLHSK